MSAYDVAGNNLESGRMAFVNSVRDYYFIERTVNSGSTDSIQDVQAPALAGVWHRMSLGGGYWKNQLFWWIDSESGNDENLGAQDVPLKTLDELVRRLFGIEKIRSDYVVNLTSVTQSITNTFGLDIEFDGGSITFQGTPKFSASLGTITVKSGAVNYTQGTVPAVYGGFVGSALEGPLYTSAGGGYDFLGWPLDGESGAFYTTAFTGTVGNQLYEASIPTINTPGIISRGLGRLILNDVRLGISGNSFIGIAGEPGARITFINSTIGSNSPDFVGGLITFDKSRVRSQLGSISVRGDAQIYGSGSGWVTPRQQINLRDCHLELASTVFCNSALQVRKSQIILGIAGASGSALMSSTLEVQSDSQVDVRNMIATRSLDLTGSVLVTGQDISIFYNEASLPKADNIIINNGVTANTTWATMPYQDLMRNTKIVSGALQSVLGGGDGSY
jgi:hypothetical protein